MWIKLTIIFGSMFFLGSFSAIAQTKVFVEYAGIFDQQCAPVFKMNIQQDQVQEAYDTNPDFQKAWDNDGPRFMDKAKQLVKKSYSRTELTLSTSLCGFVPMASPFIVNIRPYLKSTGGQLPMTSFTQ